MKKIVLILALHGMFAYSESSFVRECIPCHRQKSISLQKVFMDALLVYGGEENMKAGLAYYFRNPRLGSSVMDEDFLQKNGIKEPIKLPPKIMDEALEEYWQIYTVRGKLQ